MENISPLIFRKHSDETQKQLDYYADGIESAVDFMLQMYHWESDNANIQVHDTVLMLFLRNFIDKIDAITILIRNGSITPCYNLLRTALENFIYVSYLLQKNTEQKALGFIVWSLFENRSLIEKFDGKSEAFKQTRSIFENDKYLKDSIPINPNETAKLIIQKQLSSPKLGPIIEEYKRTRKKRKGKINWYSLYNGPNNVSDLAKEVLLGGVYEVFYRGYSNSVHGTDIMSSVLENGYIKAIRDTKEAKQLTMHTSNTLLPLITTYFSKRCSSHKEESSDWYRKYHPFHLELNSI